MGSSFTEYDVQLVNARTGNPIDDDTGKFIVLTVDTAVTATIYSSDEGTAITYTAATCSNTMTDGRITFWTANTVTSVDLSIHTADGQAIFVKGLTPSQHRVDVNTEQMRQMSITPFYSTIAGLTATASIWSSGMTIGAGGCIVRDVFMRNSVIGTLAIWQCGVSLTPSGFMVGSTGSVTGFQIPFDAAASVTLVRTWGSLFLANATNMIEHPLGVAFATATGIVFNNVTATTLVTSGGWIYITYDNLPV